jgi:hypothetical protein
MRSIQMNGPTMSRVTASADETGGHRMEPPQESFRSSLAREANAAESPRQPAASTPMMTRNPAATKSPADADPGATKSPADASAGANDFGLQQPAASAPMVTRDPDATKSPADASAEVSETVANNVFAASDRGTPSAPRMKALPEQTSPTAATAMTKTRREHAAPVAAAGTAAKVKQKADANSGSSPNSHQAPVSTNEVTPLVADGLSAPAKTNGTIHDEHGAAGKVQGTTKQLPVVGIPAAARPNPGGISSGSTPTAPALRKEEAIEQPVELKGKGEPNTPHSTKPEIEFSGPATTEGSGTVTAASALPTPPMATHSAFIKTGAQLSLLSAGVPLTAGAPQTFISTPTRLDVGIFNGTHGWVRVRAELGTAGAVNASVTVIDTAHEALRSAVPEISKYLGVEAVKVNSIEVHRFTNGPASPEAMSPDSQQSGGRQSSEREESTTAQTSAGAGTPERNVSDEPSLDAGFGATPVARSLATDGGWGQSQSNGVPGAAWNGGRAGVGTWLNVCA